MPIVNLRQPIFDLSRFNIGRTQRNEESNLLLKVGNDFLSHTDFSILLAYEIVFKR